MLINFYKSIKIKELKSNQIKKIEKREKYG